MCGCVHEKPEKSGLLVDADAASFLVDGGRGKLRARMDMDTALRRCPWIARRRRAVLGIIIEVQSIFACKGGKLIPWFGWVWEEAGSGAWS
jgi:hypothetical protein